MQAFSFISLESSKVKWKTSFLTSLQTLKPLEWMEEMSVTKLYRYW